MDWSAEQERIDKNDDQYLKLELHDRYKDDCDCRLCKFKETLPNGLVFNNDKDSDDYIGQSSDDEDLRDSLYYEEQMFYECE